MLEIRIRGKWGGGIKEVRMLEVQARKTYPVWNVAIDGKKTMPAAFGIKAYQHWEIESNLIGINDLIALLSPRGEQGKLLKYLLTLLLQDKPEVPK